MNSSNILQLNTGVNTLEQQLCDYRTLDRQIKALTRQRDALKKVLTAGYFASNDHYTNDNGELLATYLTSLRVSLDSKALKDAEPELVKQYERITEVKTFSVK